MTKKSSAGKGPAIILWIIAGLYLLMMATSVFFFVDNYSYNNPDYSIIIRKMIILPLAWTCLLIVEGILLWKFRATANRPQAWIHVVCMFCCFFLTFLLTLIANIYVTYLYGGSIEAGVRYRLISKINQYSFWAFFIVGHIFFASLVIQRFTRKNKINSDEPSSGILDEFAD